MARMLSTSRSFARMYEITGLTDSGKTLPRLEEYSRSAVSSARSNAMRLSDSARSLSAAERSSPYVESRIRWTSSSRFAARLLSSDRVNSRPPSM